LKKACVWTDNRQVWQNRILSKKKGKPAKAPEGENRKGNSGGGLNLG